MNRLDKIVFGTTSSMFCGGLLATFLGVLSFDHGNETAVQYIAVPGMMSAIVGSYIFARYYDSTIGIGEKTKNSQNNSETYSN